MFVGDRMWKEVDALWFEVYQPGVCWNFQSDILP